MGRPMMSYALNDDHVTEPPKAGGVPTIHTNDLPHYERWSASNAFDPDSEEFWQGQEVVYEAFVDDLSSPELSPSSSEPSSDIDGNANPGGPELSRDEMELDRRTIAQRQEPLRVEGYLGSDGRLRLRHARATPQPVRQMEIMTTSNTVTDAEPPNATARDRDESVLFPIRPEEWEGEHVIALGEEMTLADLATLNHARESARSMTPPPLFAEMWSDLRSLSHSPMPIPAIPSTPNAAPSPAPSVTPHVYTWERSGYTPSPASPSPIRVERLRSRVHRRRESLPASISLMT